ncbi:MAG: winged helix-turn-helix domain-containing protein [Pyrinomonadaceae bacterium]
MSLETHSFAFGVFVLDPRERVLLRNDIPVAVPPKVFHLLLVLIENQGHVVEKGQLMDEIWADSFVEESNLTYSIRQLRKVLDDKKEDPRFIETIPRRGYRFVGRVERLRSRPSGRGWRTLPILYSLGLILALVSVLTVVFFVGRENNRQSGSEFSALRFEALTNSGTPIAAVISPDGIYVAYTNLVRGQQSLWIRQLSTGLNTQIVAPENGVAYKSLEFSSYGDYVYFIRRHNNEPTHLDRVSVFGGAVKTNILTDVDGDFSISPDSRRISFRRLQARKRSLLVANIDGSDVRSILETQKSFTDNVFSPDGRSIAFASGQSNTGDQDFGVYTIDAQSGEVRTVTDFMWHHVRGVVWLPDQRGLLVTARMKSDEGQQLWKISLPSGDVEKVTHTQNSFSAISATRDLSQILLTQVSRSSNLFLSLADSPNDFREIAQASQGVVWTRDGNLIYCASSSGNNDIWLLYVDSMDQKQLTTERSADFGPKISPDGRNVVFVSDRAGKYNVWRIRADGSDPVQLTNGRGEQAPIVTADGQSVVFNEMSGGSLLKVPIDGGKPVKISTDPSHYASLSPDGTKYAFFDRSNGRPSIAVRSLEIDDSKADFLVPDELSPSAPEIVWTKGGGALVYASEDTNLVANLWRQSLNGGQPERLTNFRTDEIFHFDLSGDDSKIAIIRGSWKYDLVLATGFTLVE